LFRAAATMAKGVYAAMLTIAKEVGGKSDSAAEVFLKQLESKGRYQQDIF
jgi:sulfite reductase alpha subunit-like flavoprotein